MLRQSDIFVTNDCLDTKSRTIINKDGGLTSSLIPRIVKLACCRLAKIISGGSCGLWEEVFSMVTWAATGNNNILIIPFHILSFWCATKEIHLKIHFELRHLLDRPLGDTVASCAHPPLIFDATIQSIKKTINVNGDLCSFYHSGGDY